MLFEEISAPLLKLRMTKPKRKPLSPEQLADAERLKEIYKERVKESRDRKDVPVLTQTEVGERCGWESPQSTVSQYMSGAVPLNLGALLKLSAVLNFDPRKVSPQLCKDLPGDPQATLSMTMSTGTGKTSITPILRGIKAIGSGAGSNETEVSQLHRIRESLDILQAIQAFAIANILTDDQLKELTELRNRLVHKKAEKKQASPNTDPVVVRLTPEEMEDPVNQETYAFVTQYDARIAAGRHAENPHVEIRGQLAFKREWLKAKGANPKNLRVYYAKGFSMWPTINDVDVMLVDESKIEPVHKMVFVMQGADGEIVKRLIKSKEHGWIIRSDNPDKEEFPDIILTEEDAHEHQILGCVLWRGGDVN